MFVRTLLTHLVYTLRVLGVYRQVGTLRRSEATGRGPCGGARPLVVAPRAGAFIANAGAGCGQDRAATLPAGRASHGVAVEVQSAGGLGDGEEVREILEMRYGLDDHERSVGGRVATPSGGVCHSQTDAVSAWVKTSLRRPGNRGSANVQALGLKGEGCFTEHYRRRTEFRNVRSFVTRLVGRAFATSQIPTKQSPVSVSTKNRASTGPARTRPFVRRAHWSPPSTRLWPFTCSHPAVELSPTTWPASEHADRPTRWAY